MIIYGNIKQRELWQLLPAEIKRCLEYATEHDLAKLSKGSYPIEGRQWSVNIEEYQSVARDERFWEAHKRYADVHYMIDGGEVIDIGFLEQMKLDTYDEAKDFQSLTGEPIASISLQPGDFLVCYPEDAHRTAIALTTPQTVKKAIFKVAV